MSKERKLPNGIDLRTNGQYRARISYNGQTYSIGHFYTVADAQAALDIARGEKARGTFIPPPVRRAQIKAKQKETLAEQTSASRTVTELAESWLSWLENMGRALGTVYTYRRRLEQSFLPALGNWPVTMITVEDITRWYDDLLKSKGEGVAKQHYRTVDGMFRYATGATRELPRSFKPWLKESPVDIPHAKVTKTARRQDDVVASPAEIEAIADNMPDRERLGVLLAGWCGLRIGEVLGLRRRDISTDNHGNMWLSVNEQVQARGSGVRLDPPKSDAGFRDVPIPSAIADTVTQHLQDHVGRAKESFLFPRHDKGNTPHHPNTFRGHFNTARDKVITERKAHHLDDMTFHSLRHSCLTRLGQAGATLSDLMAFAGHSDVDSVLIYQHSPKARLHALSEQLSTTQSKEKHE
jgi:integrase